MYFRLHTVYLSLFVHIYVMRKLSGVVVGIYPDHTPYMQLLPVCIYASAKIALVEYCRGWVLFVNAAYTVPDWGGGCYGFQLSLAGKEGWSARAVAAGCF